MKKIQDLNIIAFLPEDRDNSELDVAMWQSDSNICECQGDGGHLECQTRDGIYFGTSDSREPKFCPAHFFGDTAYQLAPIS